MSFCNLIWYPEIRLPLDHVAQDVGPALRGVLHHPLLEGEVPDVELRDLAAPGLAGVEASAHTVLVLAQICHSSGPGHRFVLSKILRHPDVTGRLRWGHLQRRVHWPP